MACFSFCSFLGTRTVARKDSTTLPYATIRHSRCELLLSSAESSDRCDECTRYRSTLRAIASRKGNQDNTHWTDLSSHVNFRYLMDDEKKERMKKQHSQLRKMKLQLDRLKEKLEKLTENNGVNVDQGLHDDLCSIIHDKQGNISKLPEDSFKRVFWEQQSRAALKVAKSSKKDCRGMRWHPLMIRWCLYLRHQSQKAYENVREVLTLPSQRTLRDYTHYCKASPGFSTDVDEQLAHAAAMDTLEEWQKCVILLLDEMHIKENLVYEKHSGSLIGFTNLGDVNNHLLSFEREVDHMSLDNMPLAKSMMTFMVRGLFTSLQFPYAQFPCANISGELLFDPFWEAVYRLERCGFKVCSNS